MARHADGGERLPLRTDLRDLHADGAGAKIPLPADVYSTDSGTRDAGDISLVTRLDSRLAPSTDNSFVVDGTRYTLSAIERIGRDRYMRLSGAFSS